jgi:glycosyltransferase involved in cell wall biosynthesis
MKHLMTAPAEIALTQRQSSRISINGRFLARRPTGVDRFAYELVRSIDQLLESDDAAAAGLQVELLVPGGVKLERDAFSRITVRSLPGGGQLWEQFVLPFAARGTLLLNLCNTGPLFVREQVTVLHDAAPVRVPEAYKRAFRAWYSIMAPCIGRVARRVLTVSEFSRREIEQAYRIPPSKIGVIPESGEHMLRDELISDVHRRHLIGAKPYVLAVGSASRHKNFALLLEAIELIGSADFEFVIVGGSMSVFQTVGLKLPNGVKHLGYVSDTDLKSLFRQAACFVCPSLYEGYGLPPVEAMTLGCPVIASNLPSIREACGDAARYVSPKSASELAATITEVMGSDELRNRMCLLGLEQAGRSSWRNSAITLLHEISPWLARA